MDQGPIQDLSAPVLKTCGPGIKTRLRVGEPFEKRIRIKDVTVNDPPAFAKFRNGGPFEGGNELVIFERRFDTSGFLNKATYIRGRRSMSWG